MWLALLLFLWLGLAATQDSSTVTCNQGARPRFTVSPFGSDRVELVSANCTHDLVLVDNRTIDASLFRMITIASEHYFDVVFASDSFTFHSRVGGRRFTWTPDFSTASSGLSNDEVTLVVSVRAPSVPTTLQVTFESCSVAWTVDPASSSAPLAPWVDLPSTPVPTVGQNPFDDVAISATLRAPVFRAGANGVTVRRCGAEPFAVFEVSVAELTQLRVELVGTADVGSTPPAVTLLPAGVNRTDPIWRSAPRFFGDAFRPTTNLVVARDANNRWRSLSFFALHFEAARDALLVVDLNTLPPGTSIKVSSEARLMCSSDSPSVVAWPHGKTSERFQVLTPTDVVPSVQTQLGQAKSLQTIGVCMSDTGAKRHKIAVSRGTARFGTLILGRVPSDAVVFVELQDASGRLLSAVERLMSSLSAAHRGFTFDLQDASPVLSVTLRSDVSQESLMLVDFAWITYDCPTATRSTTVEFEGSVCPLFKTVPFIVQHSTQSKLFTRSSSGLRVLVSSPLDAPCGDRFQSDSLVTPSDSPRMQEGSFCMTSPAFTFDDQQNLFPDFRVLTVTTIRSNGAGAGGGDGDDDDDDDRARDAATNIVPVLGAVFGNLCCIVMIIACCVVVARESSQRRRNSGNTHNVVQMNSLPPGAYAVPANAYPPQPQPQPAGIMQVPVTPQPQAYFMPALAPQMTIEPHSAPHAQTFSPKPTAPDHMI
jgi:hypothetical protein